MEHFREKQLEDAVDCLHKLTSLNEESTHGDADTETQLFESLRLEETTNNACNVRKLLEEMKEAISGVKEMKLRVKKRKDNNIGVTREAFAALRKAIDEREERILADIKETAYIRERALEVVCGVHTHVLH